MSGVYLRIGVTLDGQAAGFDTRESRPLLIVADQGRGKTTMARYLSRWWIADTARHIHVYADKPREWSDLGCDPRDLDDLDDLDDLGARSGPPCRYPGCCLVVVDGVDCVDDVRLAALPLGKTHIILTSLGGNILIGRAFLEPTSPDRAVDCIGLVSCDRVARDAAESAVLDGQTRLDWPFGTTVVVPDRRGSSDFPCHRWQAPADVWMAATR